MAISFVGEGAAYSARLQEAHAGLAASPPTQLCDFTGHGGGQETERVAAHSTVGHRFKRSDWKDAMKELHGGGLYYDAILLIPKGISLFT